MPSSSLAESATPGTSTASLASTISEGSKAGRKRAGAVRSRGEEAAPEAAAVEAPVRVCWLSADIPPYQHEQPQVEIFAGVLTLLVSQAEAKSAGRGPPPYKAPEVVLPERYFSAAYASVLDAYYNEILYRQPFLPLYWNPLSYPEMWPQMTETLAQLLPRVNNPDVPAEEDIP